MKGLEDAENAFGEIGAFGENQTRLTIKLQRISFEQLVSG